MHKFWKAINSDLDFGKGALKKSCVLLLTLSKGISEPGVACETYQNFISYINCSNFQDCDKFFQVVLQLSRRESVIGALNGQVFQYAHQQMEFTFQILFPYVHLLDSGLSAFLTPYLLIVWLLLLAIIFGILVWLVLAEGKKTFEVLLWQLSILLEQDIFSLNIRKLQTHVILTIFIFSGIVFRQFYCSCLYSFMVTEPRPTDYPNNMGELINNTDFGIIIPVAFWIEINYIFWTEIPKENPKFALQLENIVLNSYFMIQDEEIQTLYNVSSRSLVTVSVYTPTIYTEGMKLATCWAVSDGITRFLDRFAVICDENCDGYWKLPFLGQTDWFRASEKGMRFFTANRLWTQHYPNFATHSFSKFLGLLVESGLHGLESRRYRIRRQYEITKGLKNLQRLGIDNGSLFSYLMLGNEVKRLGASTEESTKVSALIGTFLITSVVLGIGCIIFGLEIRSLI
ncbi:unnamed protein product [Orchesella dallaii]|uniref:Uncharacterized protein n=1 Tax=Orchesella dallaii TaxID=48710 RepID=A0ABP1RLT3_9HEXA